MQLFRRHAFIAAGSLSFVLLLGLAVAEVSLRYEVSRIDGSGDSIVRLARRAERYPEWLVRRLVNSEPVPEQLVRSLISDTSLEALSRGCPRIVITFDAFDLGSPRGVDRPASSEKAFIEYSASETGFTATSSWTCALEAPHYAALSLLPRLETRRLAVALATRQVVVTIDDVKELPSGHSEWRTAEHPGVPPLFLELLVERDS